jgi:hypothetical protein
VKRLSIGYAVALFRHYFNRRIALRIVSYIMRAKLFARWVLSGLTRKPARPDYSTFEPFTDSGSDLVQGLFINLAHRTDRREETEAELARMGLNGVTRHEASLDANGHLGASRSHLAAVRTLSETATAPLLMVLEDDAEFLCGAEELTSLLVMFLRDRRLDVLCIGNNPWTKPLRLGPHFALTDDTSSAGCYVFKPHAAKLIAASHEHSVGLLSLGADPGNAALDQRWKTLQRNRLLFCIPRTHVFIQRASFSDIQNRHHTWKVSKY